jgi:hypothetical protein
MSFISYQPEDQVISSDTIVTPMWNYGRVVIPSQYDGNGDLVFFTSSIQQSSSAAQFYMDVYDGDVNVTGSLGMQFAIAYGHTEGSGSPYFNPNVIDRTPSKDVYSQIKALIYGDENAVIQFGGIQYTSDNIIVLSLNRSQFKESINPGSFYLELYSGSAPNIIGLVDDSTVTTTTTYVGTSRIYQLLSGSYDSLNNVCTPSSSNYTISGSYGFMIPSEGLIVLNCEALSLPVGADGGIGAIFNNFSSSQAYDYNALQGTKASINNKMVLDMLNGPASSGTIPIFAALSSETVSSRYFFTRVKNADFNYTTNPTVIDSNGNLLYSQLVFNPQTYITTVGMYNSSGDLVAVAKLNKPLVKDFTKELLLRIKLDF